MIVFVKCVIILALTPPDVSSIIAIILGSILLVTIFGSLNSYLHLCDKIINWILILSDNLILDRLLGVESPCT